MVRWILTSNSVLLLFGLIFLRGPIFSLNVFGQSITILGTIESASLLLEKHSAINSDRPELQMAGKLYVLVVTAVSKLFNSLTGLGGMGL
jgi:hypothetical protein